MPTQDRTPAELLYAGVQLTRPLLRTITSRVESDLQGTGISVGQRAILEVLLGREKASAPEISAALQVKRQFVGREIKLLYDSGFVEILPNPRHSTSGFYRLTAESRALIEAIRAREMAEFSRFADRFRPEEIAAYYRIQMALYRGLSGE